MPLKVDTRHPSYEDAFTDWKVCRDCRKGERAVKEAAEEYLPKLSKQADGDYHAYKLRAEFLNSFERTVIGLTGALFHEVPTKKIPTQLESVLQNVGSAEEPFDQLLATAADEVTTVGRVGILIDAEELAGDPYMTIYTAENIINWRTKSVNGRQQFTLIVLEEERELEDPEDPFAVNCETIWRVLRLDVDGVYTVDLYRKVEEEAERAGEKQFSFAKLETIVPTRKGGKVFDYIPFTIINPNTTTAAVEKPPLLDLANISVSHYRTSADLEHGRHYVALPTPWAKGVDKDTELHIGPSKAWIIPNPAGACGFLEFTGQGLLSLEKALAEKERHMAIIAARFLEPPKVQPEAGKAIEVRMAGDNTSLASISDQLSAAGTQLLVMLADWLLITDTSIELRCNQNFDKFELTATDMVAYGNEIDRGRFYIGDYFDLLKRARRVPSTRTLEKHFELINETTLPMPMPNPKMPKQEDPNNPPTDNPPNDPKTADQPPVK